MPRILLCHRPLPCLEQGLEPSRTERDVMVRAYTLVAPVLRRALSQRLLTQPVYGVERQAALLQTALAGLPSLLGLLALYAGLARLLVVVTAYPAEQ